MSGVFAGLMMKVAGLLLLGLASVFAVQRDNFRTCDNVGFCK